MVRRLMTGNEDWDAVVVITAPVIALFHGISTGEDRAALFDFVEKLFASPRHINRLRVRPCVRSRPLPLVQLHEDVFAWVTRFVIRTGNVSVKSHRHVEH